MIPILKAVFEAHIVPDYLQSDNGGQFVSDLMKKFEQETQFRHLTGSYRSNFQTYPTTQLSITEHQTSAHIGRANTPEHQGQVERFNQTVKTKLFAWIRSHIESHGWDWTAEHWHMDGIDFVLVEYNKKPHSTTGISPDLFFYSRLKTPADREESKAQVKSMYLFLNETDSRLEPFTNDLMEQQETSNARIITMFLESRSEMFRHAETNTAKTQVANRLRSLLLLLSTPNSQVVLFYSTTSFHLHPSSLYP